MATHRSYDLIAQHVMPEFQGQAWATRNAKERAMASRPAHAAAHQQAIDDVAARYEREVGAGG